MVKSRLDIKSVTFKDNYADEHGIISGYTDAQAANKRSFLTDMRRMARSVGKMLEYEGWLVDYIMTSKGGPAVSGEVYAAYRKPNCDTGLFVQYGSTMLRNSDSDIPFRYCDGLLVLLQISRWPDPEDRKSHRIILSDNIYINYGVDSRHIAFSLEQHWQKYAKANLIS